MPQTPGSLMRSWVPLHTPPDRDGVWKWAFLTSILTSELRLMSLTGYEAQSGSGQGTEGEPKIGFLASSWHAACLFSVGTLVPGSGFQPGAPPSLSLTPIHLLSCPTVTVLKYTPGHAAPCCRAPSLPTPPPTPSLLMAWVCLPGGWSLNSRQPCLLRSQFSLNVTSSQWHSQLPSHS